MTGQPRSVVVTGGAGNVGRLLVPRLAKSYDVTVADRQPLELGEPAVRGLVGDLEDRQFAGEVVDAADAVVHLAGVPAPNATWQRLRGPNIDLTVTLLDAAVAAGVKRVVLASSVHAAGAYVHEGKVPVDPAWPAAPCCLYGASKAWQEVIGCTYAYRTDLAVISIRLGLAHKPPPWVRNLPLWLSPDDMCQLVDRALAASDVRHGIYHGVSANTRQLVSIDNAVAELGYRPVDDSEQFARTAQDDGKPPLCPPSPLPTLTT